MYAIRSYYGYKDKSELIGKTPFDVSAPFQYDHSPSEEKAQYYINKALEEGSATFDWKHQKHADGLSALALRAGLPAALTVITSYSIHYTKLYDDK